MVTAIEGGLARRRPALMMVAIVALLLVPLVAMRFTAEVRWTALDFVAAASLLGGAAIGCELAIRWLDGRGRMVAIGTVLTILLLLWAEGAVGIF